MKARSFASLLLLAMMVVLPAASADVVKVVVDDTIHPITDEYIGRALEEG